jgi:hypothetical protein
MDPTSPKRRLADDRRQFTILLRFGVYRKEPGQIGCSLKMAIVEVKQELRRYDNLDPPPPAARAALLASSGQSACALWRWGSQLGALSEHLADATDLEPIPAGRRAAKGRNSRRPRSEGDGGP